MKKPNQLLQAARALWRLRELEAEEKKAREAFQKALGAFAAARAGISYGYSDANPEAGTAGHVQFEVPLPLYLAQFPDAKPTVEEWEDKEPRETVSYLAFPMRTVGWIIPPGGRNGNGVAAYVHARSESTRRPVAEPRAAA